MVQVFFHFEGTQPEDQTALINSVKKQRRYGQRLKHAIEILSSGDGELEVFIR